MSEPKTTHRVTKRDLNHDRIISTNEKRQALASLDGIPNGEEVQISVLSPATPDQTSTSVYVHLKSGPALTDSDSGGYGDLTENTWPQAKGGPPHDPLVLDVKRYSIRNPDCGFSVDSGAVKATDQPETRISALPTRHADANCGFRAHLGRG
jgi:hypothetical protein